MHANEQVIISILPEVVSENGTIKPLLSQLQHLNTHFVELLPFDVSKDGVIESCEKMVAAIPPQGVILPVKKSLTESAKNLLWDIFGINSSPLCITIAAEKLLSYSRYVATIMHATTNYTA
jgi:hypothetical protein